MYTYFSFQSLYQDKWDHHTIVRSVMEWSETLPLSFLKMLEHSYFALIKASLKPKHVGILLECLLILSLIILMKLVEKLNNINHSFFTWPYLNFVTFVICFALLHLYYMFNLYNFLASYNAILFCIHVCLLIKCKVNYFFL